MKKSDIEHHRIGYGGDRVPAVNVKCGLFGGLKEAQLRTAASDVLLADDVDGFIEWFNALDEDEADKLINGWWEIACQDGWEMLDSNAKEIFGNHVRVWSEGRSGGWCVVEGLPDDETWDAIALGRWAKFVRWTKDVVDDIPYQTIWNIAANVYQYIVIERSTEAADDAAARLPVLLAGV